MRLFKKLWKDEAGVLLSAEAAIVGTVGVVALGTGMSVVGSAVNEELKEVGYAIRSLDQSYSIPSRKGCNGAWTAGSEFKQQPVEESLRELKEVEHEAEAAAKKQSKRLKERVQKQKKREAERKRRQQKRKKKQKQDEA